MVHCIGLVLQSQHFILTAVFIPWSNHIIFSAESLKSRQPSGSWILRGRGPRWIKSFLQGYRVITFCAESLAFCKGILRSTRKSIFQACHPNLWTFEDQACFDLSDPQHWVDRRRHLITSFKAEAVLTSMGLQKGRFRFLMMDLQGKSNILEAHEQAARKCDEIFNYPSYSGPRWCEWPAWQVGQNMAVL